MKKHNDEDIVQEEDSVVTPITSDDGVMPAEDDDEESAQARIKKLQGQLQICQQERQEYLDGWQRAKADFVNARKDDERERSELRKHAKVDLLTEILPIADNFERAMANKELWEKVDKNWRVGVEYIYTQLQTVLREHSVQEIGKLGERFDARFHQSMAAVPTDKKEEDDTVVEVVEKGYMFHDRVIRPARVKIAHYTEAAEEKPEA